MAKLVIKKNKTKALKNIQPQIRDKFDEFELPADKLFEVIINTAISESAHAVHLEYSANGGKIRLRHLGHLHDVYSFDRTRFEELLKYACKYFDFDPAYKLPQLSRLRYKAGDTDIHLNASWVKLANFESRLVITINPEFNQTIADLGLNKHNLRLLQKYLVKNKLATIVAGRHSTNRKAHLFALALQELAVDQRAVSIEQYITQNIPKIEQLQLKPEIGFTAETALRAVLAQDYDVIIIDEVRTSTELALALHLAMSGKSLYIGLANDSLGDVFRMLGGLQADFDLVFKTVGGILVLREARRLCSRCSRDIELELKIRKIIDSEFQGLPVAIQKTFKTELLSKWQMKESVGCSFCHHSGWSGEEVLSEFAQINPKIKKAIKNNNGRLRLADMINDQSLINLRQDALIRAIDGKVSLVEAINLDKYI